VFGYPGMPVNLEAKVTQASLPIKAGQEVAALTVMTGNSSQSVGLSPEQEIQKPGLLWRLHR